MVMNTPQMGSKKESHLLAQPLPSSMLSTGNPIRPTTNGPIVTHYQPNKGTPNNSVIYEEFITDEYCVDRESVRRKFGWGMLGSDHHIPVIYRNGDKYCAVRMVDTHILDNFLLKISDNIYFGCTSILGYYTTVPESLLLNEINEFHCDNFYGNIPFKQGDVLVKLEDANQLYEFLTVCSSKLFRTPCNEKRCGFLTINEKAMVPYVVIDDQKFLPLFYLDGMEGIKYKPQTVKGWNFSYLKFCFKVHGIRDEFSKSEDCSVISLEELTKFLDPDDTFKEWWPNVTSTNKSIFQPKKITKHSLKPWHQHPITVLPVSTVKYSKVLPNRNNTTNSNTFYRTISHT